MANTEIVVEIGNVHQWVLKLVGQEQENDPQRQRNLHLRVFIMGIGNTY